MRARLGLILLVGWIVGLLALPAAAQTDDETRWLQTILEFKHDAASLRDRPMAVKTIVFIDTLRPARLVTKEGARRSYDRIGLTLKEEAIAKKRPLIIVLNKEDAAVDPLFYKLMTATGLPLGGTVDFRTEEGTIIPIVTINTECEWPKELKAVVSIQLMYQLMQGYDEDGNFFAEKCEMAANDPYMGELVRSLLQDSVPADRRKGLETLRKRLATQRIGDKTTPAYTAEIDKVYALPLDLASARYWVACWLHVDAAYAKAEKELPRPGAQARAKETYYRQFTKAPPLLVGSIAP